MSVIMYAVSSIGNNNNSGSTTSASPKANGSGAATTASNATVNLSVDTPNLSTVVVGDTIRLNGRTDGKNGSDIFEITNVNDGADTVDVTPLPGTTTSGVTWAIGGAFATLAKLIFSADNADTLYCRGTFDESIDMVNAAAHGAIAANGETNAFPRLIGYSAIPGDNGLAILDSNNTKSNAIVLVNNSNYWSFENIRITRYTGQGFRLAFSTFPARFVHCEVDHCGGTLAFGVPHSSTVIDCYCHDNTGNGFETTEMSYFANCISVANSGHGFYGGGGNHYFSCIAKANLTSGFHQNDDLNHKSLMMFNCLVDGSGITQTGVRIADDAQVRQAIIKNNTIINCISGIVAQNDNSIFNNGYNNLVYNCITPRVNFPDVSGSVSGVPLFVDDDALNYIPVNGGAQIGAGFDLNLSSWIQF